MPTMETNIMTAQEQARGWLKRNATFDARVIHPKHVEFDLISSLLASLEEVQRDAECMAEELLKLHISYYCQHEECPEEFRETDCTGCPYDRPCTCPACTTAIKYRRVG